MVRQSAMLFSRVSTLLSLISTVKCVPLFDNIRHELAERSDADSLGKDNDYNVKKMDDVALTQNDNTVNIAHSPEGVGIYRDPLEILGPKFPPSLTQNLCQVLLFVNVDVVSEVVFPNDGERLCNEVCKAYHKTIILDGPSEVSVMPGYCDYTGTVGFAEKTEHCDGDGLNAECTCVYKVRCNQKTHIIMYTFESNADGYLKITYTQPDKSQCIT